MNETRPVAASIGVPTPLVDGPDKVSGRARFAADYGFRETLVGRGRRSPAAHARIQRIDTSKAEILAGGRAVGTRAARAPPPRLLPLPLKEQALPQERGGGPRG
ncbi:MAG: 4-hydroxybenzoyl-CoA reductase subunit alpha, partial [Rhodospirillales bacterium]|nr:4-hydroxybenzoyl-CoA reductase subunit alpha [Rhodospirillales bacterium]